MIVVTGATGNVGRPLVAALAAAGEAVTAVSRGISAADVPAGVRAHRGDLSNARDLKPALDGAEALFLLTAGGFAGSLDEVLELARAAGVKRVVLLSSQGVGTGRHPADHEQAVARSGLDWTVLRPSGFHSNTTLWAGTVRGERLVAAPFGDVALPTVDPLDIAEVAAAVLREPGHAGRIYTLTGPEAVSPREQVSAIADALGEPVRFAEQTRAEAKAQLTAFMPEPIVEHTLDILGAPTPSEQQVSPDVRDVLGREPRSYAEWARRNTAAFR
jgi:uncharacterized protein YbjT (DUF2867 family)